MKIFQNDHLGLNQHPQDADDRGYDIAQIAPYLVIGFDRTLKD